MVGRAGDISLLGEISDEGRGVAQDCPEEEIVADVLAMEFGLWGAIGKFVLLEEDSVSWDESAL